MLVPRIEHEAPCRRAIDLVRVLGGAVRVAVDHRAGAGRAEGGDHRFGCDIHDLRALRGGVRLAAGARRSREQLPRLERQCERSVPEGIAADRAAQFLVGVIAGAEQIAVCQQHPFAV